MVVDSRTGSEQPDAGEGSLSAPAWFSVKPKLVRDAALETIRNAIVHGHFKPGDRLVERVLCEMTGASRASVREAIRQLQSDRLVVAEAHKGPTVARLTIAQAEELYHVRGFLEARLVREFCVIANPDDIDHIRRVFRDMEAAARKSDKRALVAIMTHINEYMAKAANLTITADILQSLLARISWLRVLSMSQPGRISDSVVEMAAIIDAIADGDPCAAESASHVYTTNSANAALNQMRLAFGDEGDNRSRRADHG